MCRSTSASWPSQQTPKPHGLSAADEIFCIDPALAPSHLRGRVHLIGSPRRGPNGAFEDQVAREFDVTDQEAGAGGRGSLAVMQGLSYGLTIQCERVGDSLHVTVFDVEAGSPSDG